MGKLILWLARFFAALPIALPNGAPRVHPGFSVDDVSRHIH